jgi:hypothetical protein
MADMMDDSDDNLIWLYLSGELNAAEAEAVEVRLAEEDTFRDAYLQACQMLSALEPLTSPQQNQTQPARRQLTGTNAVTKSTLRSRFQLHSQALLVVLVCGVFGFGVLAGRWSVDSSLTGIAASSQTEAPTSRNVVDLGSGRQLVLREDQELSLASAWVELQEELPVDTAFASILDELEEPSSFSRGLARRGNTSLADSVSDEEMAPLIPDWLMMAVILKRNPDTETEPDSPPADYSSEGEDAL